MMEKAKYYTSCVFRVLFGLYLVNKKNFIDVHNIDRFVYVFRKDQPNVVLFDENGKIFMCEYRVTFPEVINYNYSWHSNDKGEIIQNLTHNSFGKPGLINFDFSQKEKRGSYFLYGKKLSKIDYFLELAKENVNE